MASRSSKRHTRTFTFFILIASLTLFAACTGKRQVQVGAEGLETASFIGPWLASSVDISIRSKNGGKEDEQIHYDSQDLGKTMGRKPTLTLFAADGSYREEIYNLNDSLVQQRNGFWHFYSDTLFMRLDVEGSPKIAFKSELKGKGLQLTSRVDWDGDGSKDDEMLMNLKRP